MAATIQAAELCVLSPCGHISTLEQPDHVNAALLRLLSKPADQSSNVRAAVFKRQPSRKGKGEKQHGYQ